LKLRRGLALASRSSQSRCSGDYIHSSIHSNMRFDCHWPYPEIWKRSMPRRTSHIKIARRDRKVKTARTALHMSNTGGQSHVIKTVTCQPARANDTASLPGRSVPTSAQFQNEAILDHSQASQPTTQKHNNDLATTNHNNNAAHSLCKLHRQYAYSSARKQETSVQTTSRPSAMPPQPRKRSTFGLPA